MSRHRRPLRTAPTAMSPRMALPIWKKSLFALIACAVSLVIAEGLLALLGCKVALYERDPYVGFSRKVPHFVPDPSSAEPGMLVTAENKRRVFNLQRFTARKPKGTYRIFCLGGSTTYGHPYSDATSFCGWLRAILPKADPTKNWELINCGGISYASYREALLMEELIQYEPDLFILLSAHNEFLEQRTYQDIIAMPETLRGVGAMLGRTRIYSAMKSGLEKVRGIDHSGPSTATVLAENPETILDRTMGPQSYHRDEDLQNRVTEHYRFNLARMADMAHAAGARIVFINPASNLRSCAPFKSEHRTGVTEAQALRWETLLRQAAEAQKNHRFTEALQFIDQAAVLDDRHAGLHYLRGNVFWDFGKYPEASRAYERARDEDVCPLRASARLIAATTEVAAQRNVPIVDFCKLLEEKSLHRIPGDDWFLDHVHPTIEGHRQLALVLLGTLETAGIVHRGPDWNAAMEQAIRTAVESTLTTRDHTTALLTLAKVLAWAGKTEEAYQLARRAEQFAPADSTVLFELGKNAAHVGRLDESLRCLQRAVELNPRFPEALSLLGVALNNSGRTNEGLQRCQEAVGLRPDDATLLLNFGEVLRQSGQLADAEFALRRALTNAPAHAEAHNNLAWVLKERGAYTESLEHFREATRLRPGAFSASLGLAWLLASHPDPAQRNTLEAVRIGERLAAISGYQNWMSLDTLAVAYAAAGRLSNAVQTAEKAFDLAQRISSRDARDVGHRLALFQQGQPFVESRPGSP